MSQARTVLEKLTERCKLSFQSHYAAVYIQTDELELIERLIEQDALLFRLAKIPNAGCVRLTDERVNEDTASETNLYYSMASCWQGASFKSWACPRIIVLNNYQGVEIRMGAGTFDTAAQEESRVAEYIQAFVKAGSNSMLRQSRLIIVSPKLALPKGLERYIEVIDVPKPDDAEIGDIIDSICDRERLYGNPLKKPTGVFRSKLITCLRGYNTSQIERVIYKALAHVTYDMTKDKDILQIIAVDKQQIVKTSGVLKLKSIEDNEVFSGQDRFIQWLTRISPSIMDAKSMSENWGVDSVRGALLCGIPGTGKSLAARKTASMLHLELIEMNVGSLLGGLVGESEASMERALRTAEAMAPCVLFVDELEKAFSGAKKSSGEGDSGTFKRMFSTFLMWMQERKQPCFILANANDISDLPDEFFRNGRFDARFAFYMPLYEECVAIFQAHLERAAKKCIGVELIKGFEFNVRKNEAWLGRVVNNLGRKKRFVTGADIVAIIQYALITLSENSPIAGREYSIRIDELEEALKAAAEIVTPYCDGNNPAVMMKVAQSYIALISKGFTPAANRVLIDHLHIPDEDDANRASDDAALQPINWELTGRDWQEYDRELFASLKHSINRISREARRGVL